MAWLGSADPNSVSKKIQGRKIGEASRERPHLSLRLNLDPAIVGSVMVEAGLPSPRADPHALTDLAALSSTA
jgi:hypothetical protein